jgi:hypothetical protein
MTVLVHLLKEERLRPLGIASVRADLYDLDEFANDWLLGK